MSDEQRAEGGTGKEAVGDTEVWEEWRQGLMKKGKKGASLVAQWSRILLPVHKTQV